MKIISETSSLFNIEEGANANIEIVPLCVMINGKTYREISEISSEQFLELIQEGHIPTSSQPPIGEIEEIYKECAQEGCIHICMADGLSGTYQTCCSAREMVDHHEKITIINSKTLCGPHHSIVKAAAKMNDEGKSKEEILKMIFEAVESSISFLIPSDFDYLKRGGRISKVTAKMGGLLHLIPVMILSEDGRSLEKFAVKRSFTQAIGAITAQIQKRYPHPDHLEISVSHADALEMAQKTIAQIKEKLPDVRFTLHELTPSFIAQGGPGCIAVQTVQIFE